jgi:hypothetical protein
LGDAPTRVSAEAIETAITDAMTTHRPELLDQDSSTRHALDLIERVTIKSDRLVVATRAPGVREMQF